MAIVKSFVIDPSGNIVATGHAMETKGDGMVNKTSHLENAETSAWGRALRNFGIGIDAEVASADEMIKASKINIIENHSIKTEKVKLEPILSEVSKALEKVRTLDDLTILYGNYEEECSLYPEVRKLFSTKKATIK